MISHNQLSAGDDDPERSDPTINFDSLPDHHPVHLLSEARMHYKGIRPPFVICRRSEVSKTVVLPTKSGARPKDEKAIKVKIVAKPWSKDLMFWTLDLHGTRYIVKPRAGGYLHWAGPNKDFHEKPLALSFISSYQPGGTSARTGDTIPLDGSSFAPGNGKRKGRTDYSKSSNTSDSNDKSDSDDEKNGMPTASLTQSIADASKTKTCEQPSGLQSPLAKRRKVEADDDRLYLATPRARRRSNARAFFEDYQSEATQTPTSASKTPVNSREETRKQRAITQIEKELDRKFDQIFTPWSGDDQNVSRNTLQTILHVISLMKENTPKMICRTLNKALNGGDGKRQPAGGRKPTGPYFNGLATSLRSTKTTSVDGDSLETPSPSSRSNRQHLHSRGPQGPAAVSAETVGPSPRLIPLDGNRHQVDRDLGMGMPPSVSLPPDKQARTKLVVRAAPSPDYITLRLGKCKTTPAFYNMVLGTWEIDRASAVKIIVTFSWMGSEDPMRRMVINGRMESYFADLLEQVDKAPCWAEAPEGEGECVLNVEIVLKE